MNEPKLWMMPGVEVLRPPHFWRHGDQTQLQTIITRVNYLSQKELVIYIR
jgi:hypothetical protein